MVGVKFCFMFSDFRQKKYTVDSQKAFFKKYVKFKDCYDIWWQPKPLESLILLNLTSPIAFYTKTTTPSNYLHLSLKNQDHYWFYIYLRMNSTRLYTPLDLSYVTNTETLITVSSCFLTYFSLVTYSVGKDIESISSVYRGFTWVERETRELFNISLTLLIDSRRLLTDYVSGRPDNISYNTMSYDHLTQNLYS